MCKRIACGDLLMELCSQPYASTISHYRPGYYMTLNVTRLKVCMCVCVCVGGAFRTSSIYTIKSSLSLSLTPPPQRSSQSQDLRDPHQSVSQRPYGTGHQANPHLPLAVQPSTGPHTHTPPPDLAVQGTQGTPRTRYLNCQVTCLELPTAGGRGRRGVYTH